MYKREHYKLTALAIKWSKEIDDLLHLGITDAIQLCANVYGENTQNRKKLEPEILKYDPDRRHKTEKERVKDEEYIQKHNNWLARTKEDMPIGIVEIQLDDLLKIERFNGNPVNIEIANIYDNGWWHIEFDNPVQIGINDLCILSNEVERIERELFSTTDQATPGPDPIDLDPFDLPDELGTALQAFRAFYMGYGDTSKTPRNRILSWVEKYRPDFNEETRERIASVANPNKTRGRKRGQTKK